MEPVIEVEKVRTRLLDLISQHDDQLFDRQDLESHVKKGNGLIRMFCVHYRESRDDDEEYDIESISQKMLQTLKWRKESGLTSMRAEDIPSEFWNAYSMYEDDKVMILVFNMKKNINMGRRWADLCTKFIHYVHNRICLPAVDLGKRVIVISDARGISMSNVDLYGMEKGTKEGDQHFPCLLDKMGVYGIPWLVAPVVDAFIRLSLPPGMKKRFKVYNKTSILDALDPDHLPAIFGGTLELQPLPLEKGEHLASIKEKGSEWGLDPGAVQMLLEFYSPTARRPSFVQRLLMRRTSKEIE